MIRHVCDECGQQQAPDTNDSFAPPEDWIKFQTRKFAAVVCSLKCVERWCRRMRSNKEHVSDRVVRVGPAVSFAPDTFDNADDPTEAETVGA